MRELSEIDWTMKMNSAAATGNLEQTSDQIHDQGTLILIEELKPNLH